MQQASTYGWDLGLRLLLTTCDKKQMWSARMRGSQSSSIPTIEGTNSWRSKGLAGVPYNLRPPMVAPGLLLLNRTHSSWHACVGVSLAMHLSARTTSGLIFRRKPGASVALSAKRVPTS